MSKKHTNNPNWEKVETILAMEYFRTNMNNLDIKKLAKVIQKVGKKVTKPANENFRSVSGVRRKLAMLKKGGDIDLEKEVYNKFINKPAELKKAAKEILKQYR